MKLDQLNVSKLTWLEPHINNPPMGAKTSPTMKRVGRTVLGVRIGCQALSRCCLNAVSGKFQVEML